MTAEERAKALSEEADECEGLLYESALKAIREAMDDAKLRIADDLMADARIMDEMGSKERAQALAFAALNLRKSTGGGK